ncbi:transmembrane protein, putative (macronuclear) [Tetrahymena thermophila SB210]|uniref:Transmembrane protein, putative n=1 Tax=Tetrahymena thermophila (strain SB210) TaxID=312017 RepID=Q22GG1_TETTS|nr:transmembrane protein, putative [Tetrahymena thermophila SB210]EAR84370.2 transmembrane protein, putative [Tetrahymena thermophila SB210]|eukprot:XP_001032033.2 transmembrane protein, putative [Tetrahymena thermophila SB210]
MEQFNVSSEQFKEETQMFDSVKQIIQKYLEKIIYGQKKFSNDFIYCYLIFLLEVKQSRKLYWLSFLMWRSKSKINQSVKQIQIIQTIQSIFEEEKLIIQKTQGHINPFYEGFISVIMFEQKIEIAHKLLDKCIGLKLLILNMMRQKLIVLQELIKLIENQQILLFQLRKILSQLAIVNEDSIDLIQIQIYYLQCLSFNESDIKISQLNQYKKSYLSEIRNIFQKDSCVAFIYYDLSANQCYFSKVSQYFERIFSVKNEDIIGKKIDSFIPSKIQVQHQSYIKDFLEEQQSQLLQDEGQFQQNESDQKINLTQEQKKNNSFRTQNANQTFQPICKMGKQMILCLNGKRNLVPVTIDLRINSLSYDQFGFTANIKKVKNAFDYIMYDSNNFEIIGLSKNINEYLFPDVHLKKINLATLFPFLQDSHTKKDDNSQNMGTDYFNSDRSTFRVVKQSEAESEIQNNNSNSRRSGTVNHSSYVHKKNLHLKKFDFVTILQQPRNKKYSTYNSSYTNSTRDQSIAKINVDKDLIFVYMEVKIFETKYKDVQNLNYLQISKVKMINPFESPQYIINFIKENIDLYLLSFTQQKIDRIISDLIKKSKQQIQELEQQQLTQLVPQQKQNNNNNDTKDQLQHYYTKNSSINFVHSNPNLESSQIQKDLNQSQTHKKANERESAGTFNQIIEEELSVSNKSDQNDEMNNENQNSFQNKRNQKQQSLAEISQNLEFFSNYQLPLISPDSTYFNMKQQHNESSSQLAFFNQTNLERQYQDNSQSMAQIPDQSLNEQTKGNFQKKNSSISNSNVRDLKQNQQKDQIQYQSTLESKFFSPRILSTNAPLESAKNLQSYSKLISSQSQQKFFSSDELKNTNLKRQQTFQNNKDANQDRSKNRRKRKNEEYRDDQLEFLQNDWLAFKQKGLKVLSKKNQMDEKRRVYELQVEIASTSKTKSSSSASAKRHLSKILSTDQRLPQMKVIQFIGLICFITIASVTLQQYFSVMNSIKNSQLDLEVLDWPSEFRSKLYYMVKYFNLNYLLNFNDFKFASDQAKAKYVTQIKANLFYSKDIIRNHLSKLDNSNPDRLIFQQLRTQTTQFIIPLYYNQSIISQTTSVVADQPGYVGAQVNISILYAALIFNQFCYWQSIGIGGRPEYFTIENQYNMVKAIIATEQNIIGVEQNEDNIINQQLNTLIGIIFSVSACCVGVILPLYTYIQIKKDKIVTLLSTFTNQKVNSLINDIYENYYNDKQFSKFQKNTPNNINFMKQPDSIKQNISQTTRLPKMSKLFCAFVLLIYIFIVSYPVIIKIITSNYLEQTSSNLNIAIQANSLKAYVGEIISINYHALVLKLYPQVKPMKLEWYMDYIDLLNSLSQSYENQVNNLTSDRYTLNRYNQANYNKIFYPLIENDICNVLSKNPQYIRNSTVFDVNNCQYIFNGFLKKGFQLSFKEFLTTIKEVSSIYSIPSNTQQYTSAQQNLFQTFNLKNFTDFQEYIEQTLDSMKYFIQDENQKYYNFIVQAQLGLIIYQMIVMVLIFVIGWYIFCLEMNKQINKTKKFLQIIDINTLIDNTYIVTFIKNNQNF